MLHQWTLILSDIFLNKLKILFFCRLKYFVTIILILQILIKIIYVLNLCEIFVILRIKKIVNLGFGTEFIRR